MLVTVALQIYAASTTARDETSRVLHLLQWILIASPEGSTCTQLLEQNASLILCEFPHRWFSL